MKVFSMDNMTEQAGLSRHPSGGLAVLVVAFNRPLFLQRLLARLAELDLFEVYVSIDGPRNRRDKAQIEIELNLLRSYTTRFNLTVRSQNRNQGCRVNMVSSLDWFFSKVSSGVVLEDDCIPDKEFFEYVASHQFRVDERADVFMISGQNPLTFNGNQEFYESCYPLIHGWYTTRTKWSLVRENFFNLDRISTNGADRKRRRARVANFWHAAKLRVHLGAVDTWDCFLVDAMYRNNLKSLIPLRPLVTNIGNSEGTHPSNPFLNMPLVHGVSKENFDWTLEHLFFHIRPRHLFTPYVRVALDFCRNGIKKILGHSKLNRSLR